MKFRYLGTEDMRAFGYSFADGATPDVKEELYIKKLTGNSHFEAVKENKKKNSDAGDDQDGKSEWPL